MYGKSQTWRDINCSQKWISMKINREIELQTQIVLKLNDLIVKWIRLLFIA